jgi:hypothetical protein
VVSVGERMMLSALLEVLLRMQELQCEMELCDTVQMMAAVVVEVADWVGLAE